jgi:hypothetical protein
MIADRPLIIAYAILTVISALFLAMPGLALLFIVVTLGGAALAPTLWLYATVLIPAYLLRRAGAPRLAAVPIGIVSVALLAVIPAQIARPAVQKIIAGYVADDFRRALPTRPTSIEFVRRSNEYFRDGDNPLKHAICNEICQRLLLTRQVQSVATRTTASKGRSILVTYTIAEQKRCPVAFAEGRYALPSTIKANIAGICIVPNNGLVLENGVSIREEELERNSVPEFSLVSVKRARRLTVAEMRAGEEDPLLQMTEVSVGTAYTPFMIETYAGLLTTVKGVAVAKTDMTVNRYDLLGFMSDELGLIVVPRQERPRFNPSDRSPSEIIRKVEGPLSVDQEMVRSILAQPGDEPFGPEIVDAIGRWAWNYPTAKAGPAESAKSLLVEILLDPRVSRPDVISIVFSKSRSLIPLFAEQILARLTWPEAKSESNDNRAFALLISHQDDDVLEANHDQILNVLKAGLSQNRAPLLMAAGRFGRDGLPFLLKGLSSDDDQIFWDAIKAACGAQPALAPELSPILGALLLDKRRDAYRPSVIVAIASLNGTTAAEQAISLQPFDSQARLRSFLEHAVTDDGAIRCHDY